MRYAIVAGLALLACGCTTASSDGNAASGAAASAGSATCMAFDGAKLGLADAVATYFPADPAKGLPANCDIKGTLHPVAGSNIGVVYRLPDNWNGKVYGIGGGGWAGNVTLQAASDALKAGESTARLFGLSAWWEHPLFTEKERAALGLTDAATRFGEHGVPDDVFDAARAQFDDRELVYLVAGIGLINMWNRFGVTFQLAPPSAVAHAGLA